MASCQWTETWIISKKWISDTSYHWMEWIPWFRLIDDKKVFILSFLASEKFSNCPKNCFAQLRPRLVCPLLCVSSMPTQASAAIIWCWDWTWSVSLLRCIRIMLRQVEFDLSHFAGWISVHKWITPKVQKRLWVISTARRLYLMDAYYHVLYQYSSLHFIHSRLCYDSCVRNVTNTA